MPTRRNTLIGLGMLTAGGAGAVATGAFSAATAERDVTAELAGDGSALLGFDPTSAYADTNDEEDGNSVLSITFDELNANANFTFEDTFRVINRGTNDVRLSDVRSSDSDTDWTEEPYQVLIANSAETWQGNPNPDDAGDITVSEFDADQGSFSASELGDGDDETQAPTMDAPSSQGEDGGWISIGFEFGQDNVDDWDMDPPSDLQLEFESVSEDDTNS